MVTARLPDGTTRDLDADDFAELVAADLERQGVPVTTPMVPAVPFAGERHLELPRKLAERTGHTVRAHSGLARRHPDPAGPSTIAVPGGRLHRPAHRVGLRPGRSDFHVFMAEIPSLGLRGELQPRRSLRLRRHRHDRAGVLRGAGLGLVRTSSFMSGDGSGRSDV
ncbi:hypothetical protein ACIBCU_14500 [Streptomyces sp. NPDC051064]|uniref:hypothetical protein n=1 Tax=Streptomyces sp. NPDC051064 TaxID=3365641 RepID=UPI0037AF7DB5